MRPDSRITRNVLPVIPAAGRENVMNKENHSNILFLITYTVILILIILQQVEGNLIYPRTVGHSIGLPGMWVLLAICIGGELMGMAGMLLGVPLAAMLYRLIGKDVRRRERDGTARS